MDKFKNTCFFCSEVINEKKTFEHIIPNGLLGKLGIKEETLTGNRISQYSRIKVPAHATCNNGFGSKYEDKILKLLEDEDALFEALKEGEAGMSMLYGANDDVTSIITTWLSKIYYGLFYDDYIKTQDDDWREICLSIINSSNMDLVRKSYKFGYGFQLPSSLYVFKTDNVKFDITTFVEPSAILMKINSITLILCICDGYLTKNYLNGKLLENLRKVVSVEDKHDIDFPSHKLAFAEILALRSCIPKSPSFVIGEKQIINMSLSSFAEKPNEAYQVDEKILLSRRKSVLESFNIQMPE